MKAAPQAAPHAPPAPHGCAPSSKQLRFRFKGTLRVMASSWGTVRSYRLSACTAAGAARQALRRRCQQANGWPPGLPLLPLLPPFPQAPCPTPNTHTRQACACVVRYALRTADCPHLGASLEVVGAAGSGTKHRWRGPSAAHLPPLSTPPCLFTMQLGSGRAWSCPSPFSRRDRRERHPPLAQAYHLLLPAQVTSSCLLGPLSRSDWCEGFRRGGRRLGRFAVPAPRQAWTG